ncbi:F-box/kelch-repeat protein At4g39560 [Capsella rubella]|uniref:F-box/kelch-repeat protein At4g39560 n=1 Tax=Capsella rubella TaxID=81985 RepID=UPI000CD53552|nr:F-box/kelch-repeat protein At4g39560 [Capsella rubella]
MSNSAATKEPPHKKRKMSPSPSSSSTLTSLPDDMVMSCLARTSRLDLAALSQVSKSYGTLVTSPDLYRTRSLLSCMENCLYVCLLTPLDPIPRCFILRRGNKSVNRLLCPIPSLPFQAPAASSVVAVDWGIYVIGGNVKGKCSKAFGVLDCRSNKWHRLPSMRVGRTAAAAGVVCGKIYVFGGCPDLNSSNWAELDSEQGDLLWKYVKGLGSVNESLSRSRLVHFDSRFEAMWESHKIKIGKHKKLVDLLPGARLSYSGPNIVLFWDVIEGDRFDMWCAEISLERRQGPEEMWGNIEWSNVVMTVDHFLDRYKVLHSVCVSL